MPPNEAKPKHMDILLLHGYLLHGTGSNLYVLNLMRGLIELGHNIYLMAQEGDPETIDCIGEIFEFDEKNTALKLVKKKDRNPKYKGRCVYMRPNIGSLLPVYVYDHYDGFDVKTFLNLSSHELQVYINTNVNAILTACSMFKVDCIQTNHAVMLPYIAYKACAEQQFLGEGTSQTKIPYHATIHGSALNFIVKKERRYAEYCIEGLQHADTIVVDSAHADTELREWLLENKRTDLYSKISLIPAGVDVESFLVPTCHRNDLIDQFVEVTKEKLAGTPTTGRSSQTNASVRDSLKVSNVPPEALMEEVKALRDGYDYRFIDEDAIAKISSLKDDPESPLILFVGKYLWTKGIHTLIMAFPEILEKYPEAKLVIAGFGPFREPAEVLIKCMSEGWSGENALEAITYNTSLYHDSHGEVIPFIDNFQHMHNEDWCRKASKLKLDQNIFFTGIIDHHQLSSLLPSVDILVAPSVFPEAFGMVAIEAMACGVYPIVTYQSAFREIADLVQPLASKTGINCVPCTLDKDLSHHISNNVVGYLDFQSKASAKDKEQFASELRDVVVDNFSWKGIAHSFVDTFSHETSRGKRDSVTATQDLL